MLEVVQRYIHKSVIIDTNQALTNMYMYVHGFAGISPLEHLR